MPRKTSPMRCPQCGKTHPLCLPPYHRVEKGKDGVWRPMDYDICKCDKEAYKLLVLNLCDKLNARDRKKSSP